MSILSNYVNKSLAIFHGKSWLDELFVSIFESSRTISYVENSTNKADTFHKAIKNSDEQQIQRAYELQVLKILKRFNIKKVELAIDGKKDLYYGKNGNINTRGIKPEHGANEVWEYIVISIISPIKFPIMAVRYKMGSDLATLSISLLEYARSLPIKITSVLFDRGFYIGHLIDYLESRIEKRPLPYLIFVPQDQRIKKLVNNTDGKLGIYDHQLKYYKKKTGWKPQTTIVVCKNAGKNKKGEYYHMVFSTNLKPKYSLIQKYKKRWNIETGFRVMEEGKIKTRSNNPLTRFFYFILRCLFVLIWKFHVNSRTYIIFKSYLRLVENSIRSQLPEKPPPISPEW